MRKWINVLYCTVFYIKNNFKLKIAVVLLKLKRIV